MLLKVGIAMMAVALAFAAIVAGVAMSMRDDSEPAIAATSASKSAPEPLERSYPRVEELAQPEQQSEPQPESSPESPQSSGLDGKTAPKKTPEPDTSRASLAGPVSEAAPAAHEAPQPDVQPLPQPNGRPEDPPEPQAQPGPQGETLPQGQGDFPAPTDEELQAVNEPRHYELPPEAIMALTIKAIDLYNVPVINDDSQWAFSNGVVHEPETSLPWSNTPQRNTFLAAHRYGYFGTSSRLVFFRLNDLKKGDAVVLEDRSGKTYTYRVSKVFVVDPTDIWVMGQVRGRDIVTLQTCTPIPTFEKRLIVRADRI